MLELCVSGLSLFGKKSTKKIRSWSTSGSARFDVAREMQRATLRAPTERCSREGVFPTPHQSQVSNLDHRLLARLVIVERASLDAVAALNGAGARPILLKGPLQQAWLKAAGRPRASGDVDVLVARDRLDAAGTALQTIGYSREKGAA